MIEIEGGRAKSVRTKSEHLSALSKEIDKLSEKERKIVLEMIDGLGGVEDLEDLEKSLKTENARGPWLWKSLKDIEYVREPVDIETFLFDDFYLGNIGRTIFPCWSDALKDLFANDYYEIIVSGAIGTGKTTFAQLVLIRMIYEISCMRNPQRSFGLEEGSNITFVCLSIKRPLARRAILDGIKSKIKISPYFKKFFKPKILRYQINFPNEVYVYAEATSAASILSLNTFGGIVDEINFFEKRSGFNSSVEFAKSIYSNILRRMQSRELPGKLMAISSKNLESSFTEKRIISSKDDPRVFVREYSLWAARGREKFSKKEFFVLVGNENINSRIIEDAGEKEITEENIKENEKYEGCKIIAIPEDFRKDFELDIIGALKDLAGIAVNTIHPFIYRKEKIKEAVVSEWKHPANVIEWVAGDDLSINWGMLVRKYKVRDRRGNSETFVAPKINPEAFRFVHIDTSVTGDCSGLTIAHVNKMVEVVRRDKEGNRYVDEAPEIYVDFMLRIIPPKGDAIIMADIRTIVYAFMKHGYNISFLSTDSFQSVEMRQYVEKKGVEADVISVDRTLDPYKSLRAVLYEDRIKMYWYQPFIEEIGKLVYDKERNKVDHLDEESKDVADSVAGTVFALSTRSSVGHIPMEIGISEYDDPEEENDWILNDKAGKQIVKKSEIDDYYFPVI